MKISNRLPFLFAVTLVSMTLFFQNCGSQFAVDDDLNDLFSTAGVIDENCLENNDYDACIFYKSPIVHKREALSPGERWESEIEKWQFYGVKLKPSLASGYLTDGNIEVLSEKRIAAEGVGSYRVKYSQKDAPALSEAMSYYWGTRMLQMFHESAGYTYLDKKNLRIVTDSKISGFSADSNAIFLGELEPTTGLNIAYDASMLIHYMAEANIFYATDGAHLDLSTDSKHVDCGITGYEVYKNDCCADRFGCSKAVTAGLSDYMVAAVFPKFPAVAESLGNNTQGMDFCGITRNASTNRSLLAGQAYAACSEAGRPGQVFAMGSFFASVWLNVREKVYSADLARGVRDLDRLYMVLLPELESSDDFLTVLDKIEVLDQEISQGWLYEHFVVEYQSRELL